MCQNKMMQQIVFEKKKKKISNCSHAEMQFESSTKLSSTSANTFRLGAIGGSVQEYRHCLMYYTENSVLVFVGAVVLREQYIFQEL